MRYSDDMFPLTDEIPTLPKRLYCFHHAGGSVLAFRTWLRRFSGVDTIPVELPGHYCSMGQACSVDFDSTAHAIARGIATLGTSGASLFGHSLGCALAFQVAVILRSEYDSPLEQLIVAGRHAPCDQDPIGYRTSQGMGALKEEMVRIGATPREVIDDPAFSQVFLPIIYSDYRLHESYRYRGERLDIPIVALAGMHDMDANPQAMLRWSLVTSADFSQFSFPGSHFFLYGESAPKVERCIADQLSQRAVAC